jgi:hypothetical protein
VRYRTWTAQALVNGQRQYVEIGTARNYAHAQRKAEPLLDRLAGRHGQWTDAKVIQD